MTTVNPMFDSGQQAGAGSDFAMKDGEFARLLQKLIKDKQVHDADQSDQAAKYGATHALGCLHFNSGIRKVTRRITEHWVFEGLILLTIFANCVALAAYDVVDSESDSNKVLDQLEFAFLAIFTIEMVLKILARGFVLKPGTYLREGWNVLDFFIVIMAYVELVLTYAGGGDVPNIKILRALRVLRSLKVVNSVPSLQQVMEGIISSVPYLTNVGLLLIVFIILYGIIGVEFFGGQLNSECYVNFTALHPAITSYDASRDFAVDDGRRCTTSGSGNRCSPDAYCKKGVTSPNNGITSFDNIGVAMLTVFQCLTLEGWTDIWYATNDAMGPGFPWIYFVSLVVFGAYFILNLVLGVLEGQFAKAGLRIRFRNQMRRKRLRGEAAEKTEALEGYADWINRADDKAFLKEILKRISAENPFTTLALASSNANPVPPKKNGGGGGVLDMFGSDGGNRSGPMILDKADEINNADPEMEGPPPPRLDWLADIVEHYSFLYLIMAFVMINTSLMATEYAGQPDYWTDILRYSNIAFVCIFACELVLKIVALGTKLFWRYRFNRYDALVVLISVIELVATEAGGLQSAGLAVFRAVRLLRLLRNTRFWVPLRALVTRLVEKTSVILSLLGLLQLLILIYALLGMQLFGGKMGDSRSSFDGFGWAYLTVFQCLTGENWNELMYSAIDGSGGISGGGAVASLYFISLVLIGDFVVLNVFLAIAVDSLDVVNDAIEEQKALREEQKEMAAASTEVVFFDAANDDGPSADDGGPSTANPEDHLNGVGGNDSADVEHAIPPYTSCFVFKPTNGFRGICNSIQSNNNFERFILFCILISSICLAAEDPVNTESNKNTILGYMDYIFLVIFAVEMVLKWIALGVILHPGSYMRDNWNILDFTAVAASALAVIFTAVGISSGVGALRVVRVLRPLRSVKRIPGLQTVVRCLIVSFSNMTPIFALTIMAIFLFAVMGVSLFKGSFDRCAGEQFAYLALEDCVGNYSMFDPYAGHNLTFVHQIESVYMNFDNTAHSMNTLFAAATTEGWVLTLFNMVDSTGQGRSMVENHRPVMTVFLVLFMILVSLFMMNLFIGFVIVTYQDAQEDEYKECILDKGDRECVAYVLRSKPAKIWKPGETAAGIRKWCYNTSTNYTFDAAITGMIFLNLITLMMRSANMSDGYAGALQICNYIFTGTFVVEALIKILGLSPRGYFANRWNVFDFVIVLGSVIDVIGEAAGAGEAISVLRIFRALRIIKLINSYSQTQKLLDTFFRSFVELPYVMMLVGMLFFVYAVVGMQLFGRNAQEAIVTDNSSRTTLLYGEDSAIDDHANFTNLYSALALLFRASTGEDWQRIMDSLWLDPEKGECQETPPDGLSSTCGSAFAAFYMITFVVVGSFVVLNLFVAVIVDNFEFLTTDEAELGAHSMEAFPRLWAEFDPDGIGVIPLPRLQKLLMRVDPPFGLKTCPEFIVYDKLKQVRCNVQYRADFIAADGGDGNSAFVVGYKSIFFGLVRLQKGGVNDEKGGGWKDMIDEELRDVIRKYVNDDEAALLDALPEPPTAEAIEHPTIKTVSQYYQIIRLQRIWRHKAAMARKRKLNKEGGSTHAMIRFSANSPMDGPRRVSSADFATSFFDPAAAGAP